MATGDIKTYTIEYDGLKLTVDAVDNGNGTTQIIVKCIEGYADINALYWNDGVLDGSSFDLGTKKDNSLNMNGSGEDWDGGVKLSSAGLGTAGTDKSTYLTAGETLNAFTINYSWDTLDAIGVRATSTSNPEGSIKGVGDDPVVTEAPAISVADAACVIEGGTSSFTINLDQAYTYDITITYQTQGGTATEGADYTGVATQTVTIAAGQTSAIVNIATIDDSDVEGAVDEHFTLHLVSAQVNLDGDAAFEISLPITDANGDGCIEDDDSDGGGGGGNPPGDICYDGLSQGYWAQHTDNWTTYSTGAQYDTTFNIVAGSNLDQATLLDVLTPPNETPPAQVNLAKQAVGAILNDANWNGTSANDPGSNDPDNPAVIQDYRFTATEVIDAVQAVYGGAGQGTFNSAHAAELQNLLEFWNIAPENSSDGELCSTEDGTAGLTYDKDPTAIVNNLYGGSYTGNIFQVLADLYDTAGNPTDQFWHTMAVQEGYVIV
jgi:hypothetical protein